MISMATGEKLSGKSVLSYSGLVCGLEDVVEAGHLLHFEVSVASCRPPTVSPLDG